MDVRWLGKNIHVSIRISKSTVCKKNRKCVDLNSLDQGHVANISFKHLGWEGIMQRDRSILARTHS
jgi:hypothetical protein